MLATIIKKDGSVCFDVGVPEEKRLQHISALVEQGYEIKQLLGTRHIKITNWPQKG